MKPAEWISQVLDAAGSKPVARSPRQCPAHLDAAPSLTVGTGGRGQALVKCHAGCDWRAILAAIGCGGWALWRQGWAPPTAWAAQFCAGLSFPPLASGTGGHPGASGYRLQAVHDYGTHLLERWRHPSTGAKELRWHTVVDGVTIPGLRGAGLHELPLYREAEVRMGMAMGETVLLVESESSADALRGWYATTWAGSATSVPVQRLTQVLGGYDALVYVADCDQAGLACAQGLRAGGLAPHMIVGRIGEDARDIVERVGTAGFAGAVAVALHDSTAVAA